MFKINNYDPLTHNKNKTTCSNDVIPLRKNDLTIYDYFMIRVKNARTS